MINPMRPAASNNSSERPKLSPANPNHSYKHCRLARSYLTNVVTTPLWGVMTTPYTSVRRTAHSAVATAFAIYEMVSGHWKNCYTSWRKIRGPPYKNAQKLADRGLYLAMTAVVLCLVIRTQAQEPAPTPQTVGQPGVTIEEVIVTGSNIPTAEEVGPQPVYILNRDLIFQFGVRNATDLVQKLPLHQ